MLTNCNCDNMCECDDFPPNEQKLYTMVKDTPYGQKIVYQNEPLTPEEVQDLYMMGIYSI